MTAETLDMPVPAAASEFADLVERHRRIVFKVAHTYCWREADRADLVQDILAELWRAFPRYDRGREPAARPAPCSTRSSASSARTPTGRPALNNLTAY